MQTIPDCHVKIGLIGAGARLRHVVKLLCEMAPDVRVVGIFDPDEAAIRACLEEVSQAADVCGSVEELVSRADVDWVFIGSWNCLHVEHAIAALEAGKHVFCEKPLALNLAEATRLHQVWKASGCTFALGLVLRYSPLYREAQRMLKQGRIGQLMSFEFNETLTFNHGGYIHGNWRRHSRYAGSHLLEKCCHDLDLALWFADAAPKRVSSFGGCNFFVPENRGQQERIGPNKAGQPAFQTWPDPHGVNPFTADKDIVDQQVAIIEFASGVRASFHTSCLSALPERRFCLLGTEGSLRFDAYSGKLELRRIGWDEPLESSQPINGDGHAGSDEPMCRELAECLAGRRPPAAGIDEGIRSLRLAEAIDTAMREGRVVVL
jgi:predicted dehydrogenase